MSGAPGIGKHELVREEPGRPKRPRSVGRPWVSTGRRAPFPPLEPEQLSGPRARIMQGRAIGEPDVPEGGTG
jgi:hypothetical protein